MDGVVQGQLDFFDLLGVQATKPVNAELYNDDCLNVLQKVKDESVDLCVTDCPYHIVSGGCTNDAVKIAATRECGGMLQKRRKDAHGNIFYGDNNHVSLVGFLDDNRNLYTKQGKIFKHNDIEFDEWLPEIYRILKPDTHCYIMINPRNVKELQQQAENVGFIFQNILIWDKGNLTPNKYYMQAYEMILMLRKGRAKNINNMGSSNILRIPNVIGKKAHPTEKPADLMQVLIENSTEPGQTVIDPFMGVGGAGVACVRSERRFIGIEIDEEYYVIAKERIERGY